MKIPLLDIPAAYHVGTLDASRRGRVYKTSYEGGMLSVSVCPNAWRRIAHLDEGCLKLQSPEARFVDVMAIDAETKAVITAWSIENGLAEHASTWRAWGFDSEYEEWNYMEFPTREKAVEEALFYADLGPDDDIASIPTRKLPRRVKSVVEEDRMLVLTDAGVARSGGYGKDSDATDLAIAFFAEDVLAAEYPEVKGVWWKERFSPERLSSPRGGIFASVIADFAAESIDIGSVNDRSGLRRMPKAVEVEFELAKSLELAP